MSALKSRPTAAFLASAGLVLLLAACPSTPTPPLTSTLTLKALAVTAKDTTTGRTIPKIYLEWNVVAGATTYEVDTIGTGGTSKLSTSGGTNYEDSAGITFGQKYSYLIRGLDASNTEKTRSETVEVTVLKETDVVDAPATLDVTPRDTKTSTLTATAAQPTLKWDKVIGATAYYVEIGTTGGTTLFKAITADPSIKLGSLPLKTLKWPGYLQVGENVSLASDVIYNYSVSAIRTDVPTLEAAKALSVTKVTNPELLKLGKG